MLSIEGPHDVAVEFERGDPAHLDATEVTDHRLHVLDLADAVHQPESRTIQERERCVGFFRDGFWIEGAPEFVGTLVHGKRVEDFDPLFAIEVGEQDLAVTHATQVGELSFRRGHGGALIPVSRNSSFLSTRTSLTSPPASSPGLTVSLRWTLPA